MGRRPRGHRTVAAASASLLAMAVQAASDPPPFHPLAALRLAEAARVDRLKPCWTGDERQGALDAATRFVRDTRDTRDARDARDHGAFDPQPRWRHAMAHGADASMPLALKPRLARPVLFVARRGRGETDDRRAWLGRVTNTGSNDTDMAMPNRRQHARALLPALCAAAPDSGDAGLQARLRPGLHGALKAVR